MTAYALTWYAVPGVKPVTLTVNVPVPPEEAARWLPLVVGLLLVLQHTPRSVTVAPPLLVTLPPQVAEFVVTFVGVVVVTVGALMLCEVVKSTSLP